jgi:hypothetical protein
VADLSSYPEVRQGEEMNIMDISQTIRSWPGFEPPTSRTPNTTSVPTPQDFPKTVKILSGAQKTNFQPE